MNTENFDIDIVYLWVDGNDPIWRAKRDAFIGKTSEESSRNCEGRYADNDELKYSLRSIEKHAPWIRNIYIVTDNQQPSWLDISCPKVKIIDLTEIMPREVLPCFNSSLIEKFLHNIPGLAEHFLYSNDDMFLYKTVKPSDFFMPDGYPIIRLKSKPFRRLRWYLDKKLLKKTPSTYRVTINMASKLVNKKYGVYYSGIPHHNIDAYLKSDCKRVAEEILCKEFRSNWKNQMRSEDDIQRIVYSYIALAEKHGHRQYVTVKDSFVVKIHKAKDYKKLLDYQPTFFCMNDSESAGGTDRLRSKEMQERLFPKKSVFEK
ncbi:MAG: stealth family protein [Bacteroidaceae bacterium]|nr:stealth family protein [Bacteroidaceae bacterium]